ncbi:alpha/beta fold hydrolase BchO [Roseisolibacter sp. H3M3-2]|uniref:alpha/beta fold hydrolase BchO n=1 Tax=Roseisolibacter sp. H3M3-2 TaxID=3031323 RepID=UPI0023DA732E|nr:alpha/beta fold hydrolase BchO [Roseisolibacter sp. H3M3-2]MDF1503548.1 alpha/beta fold hydrolase [Roseisolibacter sp. H3M3-2]
MPNAGDALAGPDWAAWRERWPNAAASRFAEADGMRWHAQVAGDGPVALLLHGTAGATHAWRDVLPALAARFTVVAPDLPGHGFTGTPRDDQLTLPGMARAVAALLRALHLRPALVVGHSAGSAVLVRMALDGALPDARLHVGVNAALVSPPPAASALAGSVFGALFTGPRLARLVARVAGRGALTEALLASTGSRLDAGMIACYEALVASPAHVRHALTMMARWDVPALLRDVHALRLPSLLLVGEADRWIPPGQIARVLPFLPHARLERVAGRGHLMHEEDGRGVAARILAAWDAAGAHAPTPATARRDAST